MTTTTLAPAEVEDLEAWLNHEIEKPCIARRAGEPCSVAAEWLAYTRRPCSHPDGPRFYCQGHKEMLGASLACHPCLIEGEHALVSAHFIERIR